MKIPIETKPALWGIVGGAVAMAIVGFTWGGWVTGGKSELAASQRADSAVVAALAPICVERFNGAPDTAANLVALRKADAARQARDRSGVGGREGVRDVAHRVADAAGPQWPAHRLKPAHEEPSS